MWKQLLRQLGILVAVAAVGFVALLWWTGPRQRFDVLQFYKVDKGMTEAEVVWLLGAPAGNYSSGFLRTEYWRSWGGPETGAELVQTEGGKEWIDDKLSLYVLFDEDRRVLASYVGSTYRIESVLEKLRKRFVASESVRE